MTGQTDLFGGPDIPIQRDTRGVDGRSVTQDMDLVISVIKAAKDPGYVVIGVAQRVYRRTDDGPYEIDRVPQYEHDAVHQLIDTGLLKVGGGYTVNYHGREGRGNSILVPKTTVAKMRRWESYVRPECYGEKRYAHSPRER
jgi:hypothetical protein